MANPIPELLVNYNVYDEVDKLIGVTGDIVLPKLEPITEKVSGAGIAGEYDSIVPGHFASIGMDINFRTIMDYSTKLLTMSGRKIYLRASQQSYDMSAGKVDHRALKLTVGYQPKGIDLGKVSMGKSTETKVSIEVLYLKLEENNKLLVELDKLNFIYILNNEDQLAKIRSQI